MDIAFFCDAWSLLHSFIFFDEVPVVAPPADQFFVRGVIGSTRLSDPPFRVSVNRRVRFEVFSHRNPDRSDSVAVENFVLAIPDRLGSIASSTQVRLTTVAGVAGVITITVGGVTLTVDVRTLPGTLNHLIVQPADAVVAPGRTVDFDAQAVDRFGNVFPISGANVGWHVVRDEIGAINSRSGLFTASETGGVGYVVAVVSGSLRFGDSSAGSMGSGKVVVNGRGPTDFSLRQNYPNPFNPETTIRFDLLQSLEIELSIYNLAAQRVAMLVKGHREAGSYSVRWNGVTDAGLELASGVYFYRRRGTGGDAEVVAASISPSKICCVFARGHLSAHMGPQKGGATPVDRRRRQILTMAARKGAQAALHALNALSLLIFQRRTESWSLPTPKLRRS